LQPRSQHTRTQCTAEPRCRAAATVPSHCSRPPHHHRGCAQSVRTDAHPDQDPCVWGVWGAAPHRRALELNARPEHAAVQLHRRTTANGPITIEVAPSRFDRPHPGPSQDAARWVPQRPPRAHRHPRPGSNTLPCRSSSEGEPQPKEPSPSRLCPSVLKNHIQKINAARGRPQRRRHAR